MNEPTSRNPSVVTASRPLISIVSPMCNEEANARPLYEELCRVLDGEDIRYEFVFVDDGSRDATRTRLAELAASDSRVKVVGLSRNFGHQVAVSAGLEHAKGDAVITMDSDFQHPPRVIPQLLAKWREGFQVVHTLRESTEHTSPLKRWVAETYYRLVNAVADVKIIPNAADFRLFDRRAVDAIIAMPERARFVRGLARWVGFKQTGVPFLAERRRAGVTKYTLPRLLNMGISGITNFSTFPLRIATYVGLFAALIGVPYGLWAVYVRLFTDWAKEATGWASLMVGMLFLGGVQLICLGIIGEYLARIYEEVKQRPLYFADLKLNLEPVPAPPVSESRTAAAPVTND